jgi:hypothetical protein
MERLMMALRYDSVYARDLAERVIATYLQAFLGLLAADGMLDRGDIDLSVLQSLGVAALPAVFSIIKGVIAKWIGDHGSASVDPMVAAVPTPAVGVVGPVMPRVDE